MSEPTTPATSTTSAVGAIGEVVAGLPAPLVTLVGILATGVITIWIAFKVNPWDKRARESILHELELAEKMKAGDRRDLVLANLDRKVSNYVGKISLSPEMRVRYQVWLFVTIYGAVLVAVAVVNLIWFQDAPALLGQLIGALVCIPLGGFKSGRIEKEMREFRLSRNLLNDVDRLDAEKAERKRLRREAKEARRNPPPPVDPPEPDEDA